MKKLCIMLLFAFMITACSCSSPKPAAAELIYNEERVEYDIEASFRMNLYKGNVYAVPLSDGYDEADGTEEQPEGEVVYVFDENGKKIRQLILKDVYVGHCWDIANDKIYSVSDESDYSEETAEYVSRRILYSSDIETGESKKICSFDGIARVNKIKAVGDTLYWLGQKEEYTPFKGTAFTNSGEEISCLDNGNVFGSIDLNTGVCTELDITHPIAFSERNGRIIVYSYDEEKGFYFYDNDTGKIICYTNKLGQLSDLEIINDNNDFVFKDYNGIYGGTLSFSGMDDISGVIQLDDDIWISEISSEGSSLCVQAADAPTSMVFGEKIYKYLINMSTADPPIRVITASNAVKQDTLFSCGYQIKTDLLSQDGFSLTVLSLDKNYDIAMMNSDESYSAEIKNKGSFYPLNDIPGVEEYINNCFPFIKDAAVNEKGEIWMLPISVDVPAVICNEKNCAEKGISFTSDFEDFLAEVSKGAEYSEYASCGSSCIIQSMLNSYFSENTALDTPLFREFAPKLKEIYRTGIFKSENSGVLEAFYNHKLLSERGRGLPNSSFYEEIYEKALFTVSSTLHDQQDIIGDENLRAAALPTVSGKNSAFCTFVCVNPNSEHLSETLLFIEKSVSRFAGKKNGFTLSDRSLYDDDPYTQSLFGIYENSEITFSVPAEIYRSNFEAYVGGAMSLDDFIAEADRKLSVYLNE